MNRYGRRAMRHWREWLPDRFQELEAAEEFFTDLGERAEEEIEGLAQRLEEQYPDRGQVGYLDRVAELSTARKTAESQIMRDLVLVDPDDEGKIAQLMG